MEISRDYYLISRILHPQTERITIIIGGVSSIGSAAAGRFVTNEAEVNLLREGAVRIEHLDY